MIASPPPGAQWTTSHHKAKTSKKSKSGKRGPKVRKAYAKGFSTGSETASEEDEKPAVKQPALASPESTEKRKTTAANRCKKDVTTTKEKQKVTVTK